MNSANPVKNKEAFPLKFDQTAGIAQKLKKWTEVIKKRRVVNSSEPSSDGEENKKCSREPLLTLDNEVDSPTEMTPCRDQVDGAIENSQAEEKNQLIKYFASIKEDADLDTDHLKDLISQGADINARDKHKQTVLHEIAANWHPSVMDLMLELGGDPNACDYQKWTPLHVAAAADYPEMCRVLVRRGADLEAMDSGSQTPLFFAAKTDSARALRALIKLGCSMEVRDYMGRTPLFAAAELDRSETSAILLEHKANAFVQDKIGQIAFVPLVEKMPPLAMDALKPLHRTFRIDRVQHLYLFRLDPKVVRPDPAPGQPEENGVIYRGKLDSVPYKSAMKIITETKNYQAIQSPVVQELIKIQWRQYGRTTAIWQLILQLVTITLWTAFLVIKEWTERYKYSLPDEGYRVAILLIAVLLIAYNIVDEIREYIQAKNRNRRWKDWKLGRIEQDLSHCHERHPGEVAYWEREKEETEEASIDYFSDPWNYLDWICYLMLVASIVTHFIDVGFPGGNGNLQVARWHVRIMAVNILLLWLRLLKYAKPFEFFGPFIVMLGMIAGDLLKFFLLYLEFLIPFSCVFWTILGGTNNLKEIDVVQSGTLTNYTAFNLSKVTAANMDTVNNLVFSVFRITLVDDYDYTNMVAIDQITAQILVGCWLAVSTILFLNLFIAQLAESFKQVYDNAKAAAAMQKAITLTSYYEGMMWRTLLKYHNYMEECNPYVTSYDDDVTDVNNTEELQKATLKVKEAMLDIKEKFDHLYDAELCDSEEDEKLDNGNEKSSDYSFTMKQFDSVHRRLDNLESGLKDELDAVKATLHDLAIIVAGGPGNSPRGLPLEESSA